MENQTMRLTLERKKHGLSQARLAARCGANASSISRIEAGKEPPYPHRAQRIADAIGWRGDAMQLFEFIEN